jgi:hypothetical protein
MHSAVHSAVGACRLRRWHGSLSHASHSTIVVSLARIIAATPA